MDKDKNGSLTTEREEKKKPRWWARLWHWFEGGLGIGPVVSPEEERELEKTSRGCLILIKLYNEQTEKINSKTKINSNNF